MFSGMAKFTETAANSRLYNLLLSELSQSLPQLEQRIQSYATSDQSNHKGLHLSRLLADLDTISESLTDHGQRIDELRLCGEDLMATLTRLTGPDTPKVTEIRTCVESMEEWWQRLQEDFYVKNQDLQSIVEQLEETETQVSAACQWLDHIEENYLKATGPISLDRHRLSEQIEVIASVEEELNRKHERLETLAERSRSCAFDEERVRGLLDRYEILRARCSAHFAQLTVVGDQLDGLYTVIGRLESWFTETVGRLREGGHSTAAAAPTAAGEDFRQGFARLYERTRVHKSDLETAERLGRELLENPLTGERLRLRETLADIREKWNSLTEILVEMLSASVSIDPSLSAPLAHVVHPTRTHIQIILQCTRMYVTCTRAPPYYYTGRSVPSTHTKHMSLPVLMSVCLSVCMCSRHGLLPCNGF